MFFVEISECTIYKQNSAQYKNQVDGKGQDTLYLIYLGSFLFILNIKQKLNSRDYVNGVAASNFSSSATFVFCFCLYGFGPMQLSTTGNNTKPWKSPKSITKENICKKIIMNSFKLITLIKAILTYFKK